jgi:hypothetical protein
MEFTIRTSLGMALGARARTPGSQRTSIQRVIDHAASRNDDSVDKGDET